ncbi:ribonuclease H-like domain-containing protein [Tanacetum coccineum]
MSLGHFTLIMFLSPLILSKKLIYVRQFVRDNNYTVEFDAFGFSIKDFMTHRMLLRCDSTGDLYSVMKPSTIPRAFLTSQYTWHQRLGHPWSEMLHLILSSNLISCTTEKPLVLSYACQLGKLVRLPFYASKILEQAHMVGCNPCRTHVDTKSKLGDDGDPPHLSALKRILRYVRGTLDYGLQLFSSSTTSLVAYLDADWAGCPTTRRSTSSYCVFLGNNLLSWSSKRQPTFSRSSAEVEFRGVANVVAETCWLRNLLRYLHTPLSFATFFYCDNVSAVYLSSNTVKNQRTKHIEIDIHFVRDLVAAGQVRVLHVPSRYQFADIFTNGLPYALFDEFRSSLSVRCPPAQTAGKC